MTNNIVVLGAGVSGLTSALLLAKSNNSVTVVAKHMPGDYDIEYTSPWAGGNFMPMSPLAGSRWETRTWPEISRLARDVPEAGIHFQKSRVYRLRDEKETDGNLDALFSPTPWFDSLMPDFRELPSSELPPNVASGCEFTSVCINTAIYLPWLLGQCLKHGVILRRAVLNHIRKAKDMHHSGRPADVVVNATGLLASKLGGVVDNDVYPIRGQIVIVRNEATPMTTIKVQGQRSWDRPEDVCYLMQRAGGGGTILGGTYDVGNWDPNPDPNTAVRIMKRCVEMNPGLTREGEGIEGLSIIRHGVGLRPARKGGVRLEMERETLGGTPVVHNYGHAGWGYQGSFGCAERVVELVEEARMDRVRSRL